MRHMSSSTLSAAHPEVRACLLWCMPAAIDCTPPGGQLCRVPKLPTAVFGRRGSCTAAEHTPRPSQPSVLVHQAIRV